MSQVDTADYRSFLSDKGISDSDVIAISDITPDFNGFDDDSIYVADSSISGSGLFSSEDIKSGQMIMPALVGGARTKAGKYSNHAVSANSFMSFVGGDVYLLASEDIPANTEITTNYRDTEKIFSNAQSRADIARLEGALEQLDVIDIPVKHHFAHGVYGREMTVPAGCAFTGKIHKTEHLNVLAKGIMLIKSSTGMSERIEAPYIFVAPPNTKRAGFAVTECVFLNIHGTNEINLDEIEKEFVSVDYDDSISLLGDKL